MQVFVNNCLNKHYYILSYSYKHLVVLHIGNTARPSGNSPCLIRPHYLISHIIFPPMENVAPNIEEWISQLARELHRDGHNIHNLRAHPVLQRISSALDVRGYAACARRLEVADNAGDAEGDAAHSLGECEDGEILHYRIPMFGHSVHLPVRCVRTRTMHLGLRARVATVRKCFVSLREYSQRQKQKRQRLIKAILYCRRKTLLYVGTIKSKETFLL